ncbi:lysine N(6)-hydroxylase/L-ornithine N(5)-oxygenase family protein [Actinacidiphila bryophytorum]|uniref:lysine N(6)-hydroxylase/L-ornithine N(5)-oxygenase family protein n=1 Tax=Actinacidiphila bryophytorum TaxID=1436133 RepID=UPI002176C9E4|nr:lysine N(6)-hydroxylase/L-ornithine N(5)-oxygenase family protein [Actinacidiphila bryophytorum]UWE07300.1 lysine N(6)-hydroxylase/L-ornithine N(5)-oxygenase family protein [Actinacidiphila bryophytorum]
MDVPANPPAGADHLPVVVVGAGPVGLAAAAHLRERGLPAQVLERGPAAADAVRQWGHVRLFSTWAELTDPAAERLLAAHGWTRPDPAGYPTGAEWARDYLQPLADALGAAVRYGAEVTGISRLGRDRVVDADRADRPFTVDHTTADGREQRILARAVIDASGTWTHPSPAGGNGLPALGERVAADRITYRVPDLADPAVRARHAGRRTAVVGSGASAFTALAALAALAGQVPGTHAVWVLRRGIGGSTFGGGTADQLPARGALGLAAKAAVDDGHADAVTGFRTAEIEQVAGGLVLVGDDGTRLEPVDEVVVLTGLRPDLGFLTEVRLRLDERLQAPPALASEIDPNRHSCGSVRPHGHRELAHPEPDFYLAGMKSYGRAPTFLAMTGYEQVRSIAAALAGDTEAADRVELTLPETGVCGGSGLFDDPAAEAAGGCCSPAPRPALIGTGAGAGLDAGLGAGTRIGVGPAAALTIGGTDQAAGGCCG